MLLQVVCRFFRDKQGSIAIIGAVALPVMIGFASLVAEYGHGLLVQAETQRIADSAAYAGALAYSANGTTASMVSAADAVAALNGVPTANVTASLVLSGTGDGNSAVQVAIASNMPLLLAPVLGGQANLPIAVSSAAELKPGGSACIMALSSTGTGITLNGAAIVNAASCSIASNAAVTTPCGTVLTTKIVTYNSTTAPINCSGASIKPPTGTATVSMVKKAITDPLAGNAGVSSATASLAAVMSETAPAVPVPAPASLLGGGDIRFGGSPLVTTVQAVADGCVASLGLFSTTWTMTCIGLTPFSFGNIVVDSGYNLTLNPNSLIPQAPAFYFSGAITVGDGSIATFGPGVYNIAKGVTTGSGSTTTFGAGTYTIGAAITKCGAGALGYYSVCNGIDGGGSSLTFGGSSNFMLRAGAYNAGGSILTLGTGSNNSFQIGPASDGNALYMAGGANTVLGDALGTSSLFQITGNLNIAAGGGSCTTLGAASRHDIKGNLTTAGGTILGAGAYAVTDYVALGGNGGGNAPCSGSSIGVSATGVTLLIGGASTPSSGPCSGFTFCVAAGYTNAALTAPTSGTYANLAIIGPTVSTVTAGASLTEAASTTLSGAIYFPNGPVTLSGGASVGSGASQCLTLIGATVTLSGGTTAASSCVSGSTSGYSVVLVQ